jgi:subtilisin family serine protease
MASSNRILVKLMPGVALGAAGARANIRPLHDEGGPAGTFGVATRPAWYLADLPDQAGPNPWDLAHTQVADQLGVDSSAVVFAEPDLPQHFVDCPEADGVGRALAAVPDCTAADQDASHNKVIGHGFAWHLRDEYSQLGSARVAVQFADPRTRIAHIDVGYDPNHAARPEHILETLGRSFADGDDNPNTAEDPGRGEAIPDNSGHGTGTIGILAGGRVAESGDYLGGAPQAEILPIRISNSVVLFHISAFAKALRYAIQQRCDVVSISMGGLPSRAWSELVNDAYEAGVCICAAAGNNVGGAPTHHVVYPARYHRTIAVCGVMANGKRYYDIGIPDLQGSWGPDSCMTDALASYTPNIPWPLYHCRDVIRKNGEGTSAATPQVAAAVALWFEKYKGVLPRDWRRVEAVRKALFDSAKGGDAQYMGRGILQANAALSINPDLNLTKTNPDNDSFSFLRVLTGLGLTTTPPREMMFNLEITQRYLANKTLQDIVPDPEKPVADRDRVRFMEALIHDEGASLALRKHLADRYPSVSGGRAVPGGPADSASQVPAPIRPACNTEIRIPRPLYRRIRTYAVDPSFSTHLSTAPINEVTLNIGWEKLEPGPRGEYLEVVDQDPTKRKYRPIDLDDPSILAQDGCPPAEGNPAFHQQMVYAVAMKTIEHFERALGRPVLWRPRDNPVDAFDDSQFVQQLQIRPHALRQANAFYSPQEIAALFGYFEASEDDPGDHVPGSLVYTCLSHDIVAHEMTHAILDGMHRRFNEPSNPDVLAFHEAFADIAALMQHFTIPDILKTEISNTRGDLESESILGSLALQFGRAIGGRGALREAIGTLSEKGVWTRLKPNPADYQKILTPHARGALLVAAVFDAFLAIYASRTADLLRIYSGGTGVLPSGAIHPDLVSRLANEASKTAAHILNMCIRALDYVPPVDITFGEYLRGIITADADLVEDDRYNYRIAFVEAFRRRGIYPLDLDTLSVDTLRWQGLELGDLTKEQADSLIGLVNQLKQYADRCLYIESREELFRKTRIQRATLHKDLDSVFTRWPELAAKIGLDPAISFEVYALRGSMRIGPDGQTRPQIILALTQSRQIKVEGIPDSMTFRGGSMLVVDLSKLAIEYVIAKRIDSSTQIDGKTREERTRSFYAQTGRDPLQRLLLGLGAEPFAALHALSDVAS